MVMSLNNSKKKVVAIITARGGSKGVPKKNIKNLAGIPLIAHTIKAALDCPLLHNCHVSTEDDQIADISKEYGAKIIKRPKELAGDLTKSYSVVAHALKSFEEKGEAYPYFVLLQPTSPLRTTKDITNCINMLLENGVNSVVSITEATHHPYKMLLEKEGGVVPLIDDKAFELPRQELPKAYRLNGAVFAMKTEAFLRQKLFFVAPFKTYIMEEERSVDIDTEFDFMVCEYLIKKNEVK